MADGRILHRSAGDSAKVSALSDLEYRVWTQYLLSADDHGVMPAEVVKFQADNRALRNRPKAKLQAAIDQIVSLGLVGLFDHQGQTYLYQPDWNDRQSIRYPRRSVFPKPPESSHEKVQSLGESAEGSPHPARAGGRETLTPTQTPAQTPIRTQTDRGEVAPVWSQSGGARGSGLIGNHRGCFQAPASSLACGRGLCIPAWLGQKWQQQYGDDRTKADLEIGSFISRTVADLPQSGPLGDVDKDFWQASWKAAHALHAPVTPHKGKGQRAVDAFQIAGEMLNRAAGEQ